MIALPGDPGNGLYVEELGREGYRLLKTSHVFEKDLA